MCHENGWGVGRDDVQAAKLYHEASEGDHSEAQHNLGGTHKFDQSPEGYGPIRVVI